MSVFHLVWIYAIKALDSRKKACWICDGSPLSGQAKILDETYANCVNQTSLLLFHTVSAAESLLIFGADVSNTFAKAPPPKQGFYIYPDWAFQEWWVNHKQWPPIPEGGVIPVLSAMQVTQNRHGCGRNMRTLFYASVVWCPLSMNHVYIPGGSMASGCSLNVKLMTSRLQLQMSIRLIFCWT